MKLWDKGIETDKLVEKFTIGKDRELDLLLAEYDVQGSMAHIIMLESIDLVTKDELNQLLSELKNIHCDILKGNFIIEEGVEDVHSQVELLLTRKLGDVGKKIHSGRSRNDQVLLDLKLYTRSQLESTVSEINNLFNSLISKSEEHKNVLIPGYTHLQVAMPSSFGLLFGAFAESLTDDMTVVNAAYKITNQNPLGSAAGYGSSFPLNRTLTTELLGFDSLNYNVVYAQMGRGKMERTVSFAISSVASTISKLAMDICLFMSQNFGFVSLPDQFTTGSSIMPHKKNPDVFELIRAKCNKLQALPFELTMISNNLPSGYFRDLQILKESFLPAFEDLSDCLNLCKLMIDNIIVNTKIMDDDKYKFVYSVENLNKIVLDGVPFRDAYKQIGKEINEGSFNPEKSINHTHEGSIGNLCNDKITLKMNEIISQFNFDQTQLKIDNLLRNYDEIT